MFQSILSYLILSFTSLNPLNISWDKIHKEYPQISGYSYFYGGVDWGKVVYLKEESVLGLEAEIQLVFHKNKISKAYLILGPRGLNEQNCIDKYKEVRRFLNSKYGPYSLVKEWRDPIIEDLLTAAPCYPISLGLHDINTYWTHGGYHIESSLFADGEGSLYIEIIYTHIPQEKKRSKKEIQNIIKGF
jgi:hypothetical protein